MVKKEKGLRSKFSGEALLKRTEESHRRMNEYGKYGRFYKSKKEQPLKMWKCKEGEHILDIIPYLAGPNNSQVAKGGPTYLLDMWVHQKIGINENDVVCLARNYNERCPICEFINAQRLKELTPLAEQAVKKLDPKRRCLYNIVCYDSTREEDKGVQLWEVAHFLFEKKILSIARNPRGGGFIPFTNPDTGKSIYFEREGSGATNTQYLGHQFIDRQTEVSTETLKQAYILDELVDKPTYDEVKEMFTMSSLNQLMAKTQSEIEPDTIPEEADKIASRLEQAKAAKQKKKPVSEEPASEKPARKRPVEKRPVEKRPVEKRPVEKKAAAKRPGKTRPVGRGLVGKKPGSKLSSTRARKPKQ